MSLDNGLHEHVTAALQHGLVAQRMLVDLHLSTLNEKYSNRNTSVPKIE